MMLSIAAVRKHHGFTSGQWQARAVTEALSVLAPSTRGHEQTSNGLPRYSDVSNLI